MKNKRYFEQSSVLFFVLDLDGRILEVNEKACSVFSYGREELLGCYWLEKFNLSCRNLITESVCNYEIPVRDKFNKEKIIDWSNSMIRDENGVVSEILISGIDFSEKRKLEKKLLYNRLLQSSKLLSLEILGAGITHELNNPLTIVSGFSQEALKKLEKGDVSREYLLDIFDKILKQSQRISGIIGQIRDLSRSPKMFPEKYFTVTELIEKSLLFYRNQFESHSIIIKLDIKQDIPNIWGNIVEIKSVLQSLLQNVKDAFDGFSPVEGKKTLTISSYFDKDNDLIVIEVKDNAMGIHEEDLARVFDPLFSTKSNTGSIGMGLAMCREIMTEYGGSVEVSSEFNRGTTIVLKLVTDYRKKR